ncbi:AAA family ATPase [Cellulomonas sp. URHD0024]|uniref:AAA family ATPase n=1 Tax=Cellulomonas sp. URHD0024 TaxID=1302620 RepID=UPI0003F99263|nr:AAA family ATPase [Cellulomonas sp. URHD0024]
MQTNESSPLSAGAHDIAIARERIRRRRVVRLLTWGLVIEAWVILRSLLGHPILPTLPTMDPFLVTTIVFFGGLLGVTLFTQVFTGRSSHVTFRPEQIDISLDDVIGIEPVKEDVRRSIDLFQTHRQFAEQMGGTPRRGLLFEGLPGTGKTMTAKAMAREAGVPFLFVSATSFQSSFYGATARKIRSYFKALRKMARAEGGAIGFIEEIDAIALARSGTSGFSAAATSGFDPFRTVVNPNGPAAGVSDATGGVVNELLIQMQSFDLPTNGDRFVNWCRGRVNLFLPAHRQLTLRKAGKAPILLIAATNRGDSLDPAILRPGRFDRRLTFSPPDVHGRRALVDHFLSKRSVDAELDDHALRERIAAATNGWTPVMIEHLMDEALVNALRRGSRAMNYSDVEHARITEMVGIGQPVTYTEHEQRLIATHEAGHAVTAWLVAPTRNLEVLTIVRRGDALGMLASNDCDEVYTRSHYDLRALVQIAMGGWVAEELFFGQTSTGPAGDLAAATRTAAQMVGAAGMTGSLISFAATPHDLVSAVLSDGAARAQLEGVLDDARSTVRRLLSKHRHLVEALRDALLERHELIGVEITDVLEGAVLYQERLAEQTEADNRAAVAAGAAAALAAAERLRVA